MQKKTALKNHQTLDSEVKIKTKTPPVTHTVARPASVHRR